jgi:hypothetical protein
LFIHILVNFIINYGALLRINKLRYRKNKASINLFMKESIMKKTILYLSLVSSLAVLPTVAMENDENRNGTEGQRNLAGQNPLGKDEIIAQLESDLVRMAQVKAQQEEDIAALRRELAARNERAREREERVEVLSPHQRALLPQREQGKIGDEAWNALGGDNLSLAAALLGNIQIEYPEQSVEAFIDKDAGTFRLRINGVLQGKLYKF